MALHPHLRGSPRRARRVGALLVAAACTTGTLGFGRLVRAQPGAAPNGRVAGAVRDSASGKPLSGAAVQLRDSLDRTVGEAVTDERGRFVATGAVGARRMRIVRLGFRPVDVPLAVPGAPTRDVALAAVPPLLAPLRVAAAAGCPRNTNTAVALGLLEQVRAGLLATVIAGAQQPRALTVLSYVRE